MKNFFGKLGSRKLWLAVAGVLTGIAIIVGVDASTIETVAGAVTTLISAVTYIVVEGKVDADRVKTAIESVQEVKNTIENEGE
jgi:hypothetical protein